MKPVIAFDCETWLIEPGLQAPPLVCFQWMDNKDRKPRLLHRDRAYPTVRMMLAGNTTLVGHNVAFDMTVICAQWPDLIPLVFAKYDRDEVTDTLLRDQLIQIAAGEFRSRWTGEEMKPVNYTLLDVCARRLGRMLVKEGFRMFYRAFDQEPDIEKWDALAAEFQERVRGGYRPEWFKDVDDEDIIGLLKAAPSEARTYALEDANTTMEVYEAQERYAEYLKDQFRQARAAFALRLISCWGFYTEPEAVDDLERAFEGELEALKETLVAAGLIRSNGVADTKAAMAAMEAACMAENLPIARTKGGKVSMSAEACMRFDEDSIIGQYSKFLSVRKTLANDIKLLRSGCEVPIQCRYDMADTGRTRASNGVQAINRGAGIREAIRPRPGFVFMQADFEGLELHTLAQWCLSKIGRSELAKALNAKKDVHTMMACKLLGITYEEGMRRKKAGDKVIKEYRQRAKPINFGYPGGLGIEKFRRFAKVQYNVDMTEDEARAAKQAWLEMWPEMLEFFQIAAQATANPAQLADEWHLFSERLRGNQRYSALCNGRFQGLGADAAKLALWGVTRAQYTEPSSPLYGTRTILFVHDELIAEVEPERGPEAASELGRVMCLNANQFLPDVPVRTEPLLMSLWSKAAEPIYDETGRLKVWSPDGQC